MYSEHLKNKIWKGSGKIQAYISEFVDDFLRSCILYSDENSELIKMIEAPRKEQVKFLSDLRKAASHYEVYRPEIRKTMTEKPTVKATGETIEKMFADLQKKFQGWPVTGAVHVVPEGFHRHDLKREVRKELEKQVKKRGKKRGSK